MKQVFVIEQTELNGRRESYIMIDSEIRMWDSMSEALNYMREVQYREHLYRVIIFYKFINK